MIEPCLSSWYVLMQAEEMYASSSTLGNEPGVRTWLGDVESLPAFQVGPTGSLAAIPSLTLCNPSHLCKLLCCPGSSSSHGDVFELAALQSESQGKNPWHVHILPCRDPLMQPSSMQFLGMCLTKERPFYEQAFFSDQVAIQSRRPAQACL